MQWMRLRRQLDAILCGNSGNTEINAVIDQKCEPEVEILRRKKNRFPITDRFSILLSTFDRVNLTLQLIQHYRYRKLRLI